MSEASENEAGLHPARSVGLITVEPGSVTFPSTTVGQATTRSVLLHNPGPSLAQVLLGIPEPFTVALTVVNLQPGEEQTVDLRLEPTAPGLAGAVLMVQSEDQRLEIPVQGEVEPAPDTGSTSPIEARN
ncbi:MAG: hypothetical protein ACJ8AT_27405 [Hyalangium sp.]|uniref:hypothetical protein n=1 Tax=Hyalangium sp. TaxID=2028555 RepID=UPI00389A9833